MNNGIKWNIYSDMKYIKSPLWRDDKHTYKIFMECIRVLKYDCDYFYPLMFNNANEFDNLLHTVTSDIVLIATKDCYNILPNGVEEDSSTQVYYLERVILNLVDKHPNKTFIVFNEYIQPNVFDLFKRTNVKSVQWSNLFDECDERKKIPPMLDKNECTSKVGISLNRQMREHRILTVAYLYGKELQKYIHLSAVHVADKCSNDLMDLVSWDFSKNETLRDIAIDGFNTVCSDIEYLSNDEPYDMNGCEGDPSISIVLNNADNYKNKLHTLYHNSYVEIVSEPLFAVESGIITEKFANCVYGCNFPIILSSTGTVKFLTSLGFDMFDDIVNHDYDMIKSPAMRLERAINDNIELFTNGKKTIRLWNEVSDRFQNNVELANNIGSWYSDKVISSFKELLKNDK